MSLSLNFKIIVQFRLLLSILFSKIINRSHFALTLRFHHWTVLFLMFVFKEIHVSHRLHLVLLWRDLLAEIINKQIRFFSRLPLWIFSDFSDETFLNFNSVSWLADRIVGMGYLSVIEGSSILLLVIYFNWDVKVFFIMYNCLPIWQVRLVNFYFTPVFASFIQFYANFSFAGNTRISSL